MRKKSIGWILLIVLLGALVGSALGEVLGLVLPNGFFVFFGRKIIIDYNR